MHCYLQYAWSMAASFVHAMTWPFIVKKMLNQNRNSDGFYDFLSVRALANSTICSPWIRVAPQIHTQRVSEWGRSSRKKSALKIFIFEILINYLKHVRTLPFFLALSSGMANKIIWWLCFCVCVFVYLFCRPMLPLRTDAPLFRRLLEREIRNANTHNGNTMPRNTST